jgi:hypothetical protein
LSIACKARWLSDPCARTWGWPNSPGSTPHGGEITGQGSSTSWDWTGSDLFGHEFTIDRDGQVVATVSKRWLTLTASYAVEVAPGEDDLLILASVLALDLAIDAEHHH